MNDVYLIVNGYRYGGWKDVDIDLSMETISGRFRLSLTEKWPGQEIERQINLFDTCEVRIGADTVITGYVEEINPRYDAETHTLEVSGRDKSGDLVDSSAKAEPGQWKNQKLEQIAGDLTQAYGISVQVDVDTGEPFKVFAIEQGETVLEAIERMAKLRGLLVIPDGSGNLLITRASRDRAVTALVTGQNILSGAARFNSKDRFSEVIVKGQAEGADNVDPKANTQPVALAKDTEVPRHRPLILIAESQVNTETAQKRADWEINTRKAKGFEVSYTVAGWRQNQSGPLWRINQRVLVRDPVFKINETLLVSAINYRLSESTGRITELTLARPGAFDPEPTDE